MATPTGSTSVLGAARFQGHWNAATNTITGYDNEGATVTAGTYSGALVNGGYATGLGLPAEPAIGDYLQVTTAGSTSIDGASTWQLNDWIFYSGSTYDRTVTSVWKRISFKDTIASLIVGDVRGADLHTSPADVYIIMAGETSYLGPTSRTQLQTLLEVLGSLEINGVAAVNKSFNAG